MIFSNIYAEGTKFLLGVGGGGRFLQNNNYFDAILEK